MIKLCNRAKRMKNGVSLFKVYNINGKVSLAEAVVNCRVKEYNFLNGYSSPFVEVMIKGAYRDGVYAPNCYAMDHWFLADMNVQGSCNKNRVFFKKKAAQNYIKLLVSMGAEDVSCEYS